MRCPHCDAPILTPAANCPRCQGALQPTKDPLLGQTIDGQFLIQRKLGEGGFGAVYLAEQTLLGRPIALKTLHRHLSSAPTLAARFLREAKAAGGLTHPSAVKIVAVGVTPDGTHWLAMEYLQGKNLREHLKEHKKMSAPEAVGLLSQVCDVLEEAHQKGIVHRDLKPENIMLSPLADGRILPKLLDFGIASLTEDGEITKTGVISGTPAYMPPEQWKGLRHTDARSDIYALGIIAYQCLSGALPFEADSAPEWLQKHCFTPPKPLQDRVGGADVPPRLMRAVMRALEKEPSDRPQSAREFKESLANALRTDTSEPVFERASPPPISEPPRAETTAEVTPRKRAGGAKKISWLVLLAVLAVVLILIIGKKLRYSDTDQKLSCQRGEVESCQYLCALDDPEACLKLGHMYYQGQGMSQDFSAAIKMYQRSCDLGSFDACYTVAPMYQFGIGGTQIDAARGNALNRAASQKKECDRRSASSCLALSTLFSTGDFVQKNDSLSQKFAKLACEYGEKTACQ